jgi:ribosome-binding factor A
MKIYLSVFPERKEKEIINFLNKNSYKIKRDLIKRTFLRHLPQKIIFYSSSAMKEAEKVLKLIDEIEKEDSTQTERSENRKISS